MRVLCATTGVAVVTGDPGAYRMVADVKRAYFHAKLKRPTYVRLLPEDIGPGEEGVCGWLNYSMYGTYDAAANWSEQCTNRLAQIGFKAGFASPCMFFLKERGLRAYIHGGDFVVVGMPSELKWMQDQLEAKRELTVEALGPDKDQKCEVSGLNRVIRWPEKGIGYEEDPRHVEIILKLDIEACKPFVTQGATDEGTAKEGDAEHAQVKTKFGGDKLFAYRAFVARANYLAPDRPDIAFAVGELARGMSSHTACDWQRLNGSARCLKGRPRIVKRYDWQKCTDKPSVFTDGDWVGDKATRKSSADGCLLLGKCIFKGWSKTQTLIVLSSGESELYATLKAASECRGNAVSCCRFGYTTRKRSVE